MPLSASAKPKELWSKIPNKNTGGVYQNLERCNDIEAWNQDNPELSDKIDNGMQAWLDADKANEAKLTSFTKEGGYQYKDTDGIIYKILKGKDNTLLLSRVLPGGSGGAGGYKKGGGFLHMRTVFFKKARDEEVAQTINNQEPGDNWTVTFIRNDSKGDLWQLENKRPYSPIAADNVEKKDVNNKEEETSED
jgi:hypothetical protein